MTNHFLSLALAEVSPMGKRPPRNETLDISSLESRTRDKIRMRTMFSHKFYYHSGIAIIS